METDENGDATGANGKKKNIISLKDKIVLGPIDRYKKYNHFPYKFILHILLIAVTSLQVLTIVAVQTDYAFNSQLQYLNKFMTDPLNGDPVNAGQTISITNIDTLRDFVEEVVTNFINMDSDENFEIITLPDDQDYFVELVTRNINN